MRIGYARVSKADGSQSLDLQRDALRAEGIGDVLVVWKLDRLGRNLAHLVHTVQDLSARSVGLRVLAGQGARIDTTTAAGRPVFSIFAARWPGSRPRCRKPRCGSPRPRGPSATPPCPHFALNSGSNP